MAESPQQWAEEAEASDEPDGRLELPRGHWVDLRDPWAITEAERNEITAVFAKHVKAASARSHIASGMAGTLPPPGEDDVDVETMLRVRNENAHHLLAALIVAWGGPLLDGKEPSVEALDKLPIPLFNALDEASTPALEELFPVLKKRGTPTTP